METAVSGNLKVGADHSGKNVWDEEGECGFPR